ncbi:D-glycerate dehydrogenase [Sphingobacterium mizutaii NBRC 14946 = DSM 11724]|uniref:Glyoxylate/hydroxypyruvate reductase B n=2 Tax=Sphingobacterium mizutaii TaxID=1010 RepID=A0AAJ4XCR1_9SPHI|nr:D-glycerate dehydrogenase [Sphingobacterium mizutaii]GEM69823.1 D-glycerate dehydrogenase [Sphingobacterium mizutaii NBRC 14946 = DSM 11724]SDL12887.1 Lactate dehydrogenase [Sphingobacterium mizutaii]SNV51843.1 Glyoxylate/hydroxypyruvate reductase B [Sphingobacterium mizutaii]
MKIFINKLIPEVGMEMLARPDIDLLMPENPEISYEEWISYCQQCDAILNIGAYKIDAKFFDLCPSVKAVSLFSVGYDQVDLEEATRRGIPVSNTPDVLSKATSDISFMLMLMVSRMASFHTNQVRVGVRFKYFNPIANLGQELYGKTLGVFGLGRIGYEMAIKCQAAYQMPVIYHNRNRNEELEEKLGAKYVSFEELLAQSDVLSIHANYAPEYRGLFNKEVFEQMKSNAIIVNTARGGFINEQDLDEALSSGKVWGAGLDVTDPEPMLPDNPLLKQERVCVLPHIGSATMEARGGMARIAAENIVAFVEGEKLKTCLNPEVYS